MIFRKSIILTLIFSIVLLVFWRSIFGFSYFKYNCYANSGFRVDKPISRDKIWKHDDYFRALALVSLDGIKAIRYKNHFDDEKEYDLFYVGGDLSSSNSYKSKIASQANNPVYSFQDREIILSEIFGIKKYWVDFYDLQQKQVVSQYVGFTYQSSFFSFEEGKIKTIDKTLYCEELSVFRRNFNQIFR